MKDFFADKKRRTDLLVIGLFLLLALVLYNGGSNILVIEGGQAWLSEANCPDLLCVHQGKIRYTGQSIICLPNRLTVTVEGGEDDGVDFVTG